MTQSMTINTVNPSKLKDVKFYSGFERLNQSGKTTLQNFNPI